MTPLSFQVKNCVSFREKDKKTSLPSKYRKGMRIASLAIEAAVAPAIGVWLGMGLDKRYSVSPWATLCGAAVGGVLSLKLLIKIGRSTDQDE